MASCRVTAAGAEQSEQLLTVLYSEALTMLFGLTSSPGRLPRESRLTVLPKVWQLCYKVRFMEFCATVSCHLPSPMSTGSQCSGSTGSSSCSHPLCPLPQSLLQMNKWSVAVCSVPFHTEPHHLRTHFFTDLKFSVHGFEKKVIYDYKVVLLYFQVF